MNLYRLSKDQSGYNFDFRMEYKLLKKKTATVRYGGGNSAFFFIKFPIQFGFFFPTNHATKENCMKDLLIESLIEDFKTVFITHISLFM